MHLPLKNKTKNNRNKSQKGFLNENKHMQGWNPQKSTKLDTTTLSLHLVPFCQLCTPQKPLKVHYPIHTH